MDKKTRANHKFNKLSIYVIAHADDWQLFMHPHVYNDLVSSTCKVIFIFTTAGDAGMNKRFWSAREEGTKSSVRFCLAPLSSLSESGGTKIFNNHRTHYWSINNTTSWFLRLPDGNLDGNGHNACNFQSLSKLYTGQIDTITTVDNSCTYNWSDIVAAIESIIIFEKGGISNASIQYLNPDIITNPKDHPDHIATGYAVQETNVIKSLRQLLFIGYSTCNSQVNLPLPDLVHKAGIFAAYEKAVYDHCGYSTLRENPVLYSRWCCKEPRFEEILPPMR